MINTRIATRSHLTTSIDVLHFKSIILCLDAWRTFFNYFTGLRVSFSYSQR